VYSRTLGISNEQRPGNLETFNERLREQYAQKKKIATPLSRADDKPLTSDKAINAEKEDTGGDLIERAKSGLSNLNIEFDFETILIIGLILLILNDADAPDLILLAVLAAIIF
jgi:hypothetical protein